MAVMIPAIPDYLPEHSVERHILESLAELPDDYFIFHHQKIESDPNDPERDGDTDMVIFNKEKGIICINMIQGLLDFQEGRWYYGSGKEIEGGGPDKRTAAIKQEIIERIKDSSIADILNRCSIYRVSWFPAITDMLRMYMEIPHDFSSIMQLAGALDDGSERFISRICSPNNKKTDDSDTNLSEKEAYGLITDILSPMFHVFPDDFVF